MRFIQGLTPETLSVLTRIQKQSRYPHVRQRAHCIMLSFRGYSTSQLQDVFQVSRLTIYNELTVLGFMNRQNGLPAYSLEGMVNSDIVIDCIDHFCQTVTQWTVIVIDNASIHKSKDLESQHEAWRKQNVELFFLLPSAGMTDRNFSTHRCRVLYSCLFPCLRSRNT